MEDTTEDKESTVEKNTIRIGLFGDPLGLAVVDEVKGGGRSPSKVGLRGGRDGSLEENKGLGADDKESDQRVETCLGRKARH